MYCIGFWALSLFLLFFFFSHSKVTSCNQPTEGPIYFIYRSYIFLLTGNQSGFLIVVEPKWNFLFCVGHFKAADILRCQ